ncbi:MAG: hypothetical protein AVO35_08575 [Candidatus Aegiribacteria sp. MLS_C]|nr:MAG: hypothetical protein AVO35_08575 [Candidatus Aegiribacteria sp. MLS_C]
MMNLMMALLASFPVRVAVLGDRTGSPDSLEYSLAVCAIELMSPDIVLSVGDFVEGNGDPEEAGRDWDRIMPVLQRLTGRFPFVFTPGNNDIWNEETREMWVERTGAFPDRRQELMGVTFVAWDSSVPDSLLPEHLCEIDSLTDGLGPGDPWIFVTHKPFWFMSGQDPSTVAGFRALMEDRGALAVIGGHLHLFASQRENGILYVSAGPSGSSVPEPDPCGGALTQLGWMTLWPDSVEYAVVDARGVYSATVNTGRELDLAYRYRRELLAPGLLEQGLESAILRLRPVEDVPRDLVLEIDPGTWGMAPEEVRLEGFCEPAEIVFTLNHAGSPYPAPEISVRTLYGDRDRELVFSEPWPVLMRTNAFLSDPVLDGILSDGEYRTPWNGSFADPEGFPSDTLRSRFGTATDGQRLFIAVELEDSLYPEEDFSGVILSAPGDSFLWFRVFSGGTVDACVLGSDRRISPLEEGYRIDSREDDGGWRYEIAVDKDLLEIIDDHARLNIYRSAGGLFESWAYPAVFDEAVMGLVWIQPEG